MKNDIISDKTKFPLKLVITFISALIYVTAWCVKIDLDVKASVTREQAQTWILNQEQANKKDNPSIVWTALPPKEQTELFHFFAFRP